MRRLLKWLFFLVLLLLVLPALQVGCVRFIDPPVTTLIAAQHLRSTLGSGQPVHHEWLSYAKVPPDFLRAVWVAEDHRFFKHNGFDWHEIRTSMERAKRIGKTARGASTITQQAARSLFLWQGRSWIRKGLETYYTFLMELFLPKKRILELYVNLIEMGDGVFGLGAAAKHHYGIPAGKLTRSQCAMLAAILPNPHLRDPKNPSSKQKAHYQRILRRAAREKFPE